ncbi:MAG TPA: cell division topological specificity factor MinE [Ktedonobacteraceae bacterium]|jgi:cell division topological specificity factor|nr:cell division topological specificity factor MinE [Ktedonobacteraceae bacterium]
MGLFEFMAGRKKPTPGEVAKERLKVALVHDRIKVNPELLELIKADLLTVISRRLDVDEQHVQLSMAREDRWDKLQADVPIKRQKIAFEWDPPAHTTAITGLRGKMTVEVERESE